MPQLQGAFAAVLEERRDAFNARFAAARRSSKSLQGPVVLAFLRDTVGPVVEAVAAVAPERAALVAETLYEVGLGLLARDLLGPGARRTALNEAWTALFPRLARRLAEEPERVARAVSNAVLATGQTERHEVWSALLLELDGVALSAGELLEAGKLAAWRAGLPWYRRSALELAGALRPALVGTCLGVPLADEEARDALLARLRADPWLDPAAPTSVAQAPRLVAEVGGFRGFGGSFLAPPRVARHEGALLATDGQATFSLHADRFGAGLLRAATPFPEAPTEKPGAIEKLVRAVTRRAWQWPSPAGLVLWSEDGTLSWGGRTASFPDLAGAASAACDGHTLAIAHPRSHFVSLFAPARGGP